MASLEIELARVAARLASLFSAFAISCRVSKVAGADAIKEEIADDICPSTYNLETALSFVRSTSAPVKTRLSMISWVGSYCSLYIYEIKYVYTIPKLIYEFFNNVIVSWVSIASLNNVIAM